MLYTRRAVTITSPGQPFLFFPTIARNPPILGSTCLTAARDASRIDWVPHFSVRIVRYDKEKSWSERAATLR
jgi:hypothetical protein